MLGVSGHGGGTAWALTDAGDGGISPSVLWGISCVCTMGGYQLQAATIGNETRKTKKYTIVYQ